MAQFPFIGGAYTARSKTFDSQRCINLYPEKSESGPGPSKSIAALIGTPGLRLMLALAGGPVRGLLRLDDTRAVAVIGQNVYVLNLVRQLPSPTTSIVTEGGDSLVTENADYIAWE